MASKGLLSLTARAASQITKILAQQAKPHFGLRIAIQRGGCSGLNYKLDLVEKAEPGDEIIEMFGAKVAVDPKSAVFVTGSEIDYVTENLRSEFKFNNPNAAAKCGCGESFKTKPDGDKFQAVQELPKSEKPAHNTK